MSLCKWAVRATITGSQDDLNLGIHLYMDGAPTDAAQLDTSLAGEHTIDYVATSELPK